MPDSQDEFDWKVSKLNVGYLPKLYSGDLGLSLDTMEVGIYATVNSDVYPIRLL